jgi:mannan endo-1,6-alpha-mannosidase
MPILKSSTAAAVKSCNGPSTGHTCGFVWTGGTFDGRMGAGEQMNVVAALTSLLIDEPDINGPLTNSTGGTSVGDPNAGVPFHMGSLGPITTGDRAGAAILTIIILVSLVSATAWVNFEWQEHGSGYKARFGGEKRSMMGNMM